MALAMVLTTAACARADRLIMETGEVLHGDVERTEAGYELTSSDGRRAVYPHNEVRRAVYISRVTPDEAAEMMSALRALLEPVLTMPEPEQFIFFNDVTTFDDFEEFDAASARFRVDQNFSRFRNNRTRTFDRSFAAQAFAADRSRSATLQSTVERDKTADNVFADEWLRYVAPFEAVAADARYKALTDFRTHADSLGDFSRRAPEEYAEAAAAVRAALAAVDECLDLAVDTRMRISALPLRTLEHDEAIRKLELRLEREKDQLSTARDYRRQKLRVLDAEERLRKRIAQRDTELARARRIAERKINEFAGARELADRMLESAHSQLEYLAQSQP